MGTKKTYDAVYLRNYRKEKPQKAEQWRITSEIKHLESLGYIVTKPANRKPLEEMTQEELQERIYHRQWRAENREQIRQYFSEYRKAHPEKFRQNTEKHREYKRRWRAEHRESVNAYARQWYQDHPERIQEYNKRRKQRYLDALEAKQKGVNENE